MTSEFSRCDKFLTSCLTKEQYYVFKSFAENSVTQLSNYKVSTYVASILGPTRLLDAAEN